MAAIYIIDFWIRRLRFAIQEQDHPLEFLEILNVLYVLTWWLPMRLAMNVQLTTTVLLATMGFTGRLRVMTVSAALKTATPVRMLLLALTVRVKTCFYHQITLVSHVLYRIVLTVHTLEQLKFAKNA